MLLRGAAMPTNDQVRAGDQSQDRQGAWPQRAADAARARRGDEAPWWVTMGYARVRRTFFRGFEGFVVRSRMKCAVGGARTLEPTRRMCPFTRAKGTQHDCGTKSAYRFALVTAGVRRVAAGRQ